VSLSRLWHRLGRNTAAGELVAGSIPAITDSTVPDVVDARALLASC
jgi:hypothetical protein